MVISREGRPAIHRSQTVSALRERFGEDVLEAQIKERVAVSKSAEEHISIFDSDDGYAKREFTDMAEEILSKI